MSSHGFEKICYLCHVIRIFLTANSQSSIDVDRMVSYRQTRIPLSKTTLKLNVNHLMRILECCFNSRGHFSESLFEALLASVYAKSIITPIEFKFSELFLVHMS